MFGFIYLQHKTYARRQFNTLISDTIFIVEIRQKGQKNNSNIGMLKYIEIFY